MQWQALPSLIKLIEQSILPTNQTRYVVALPRKGNAEQVQ
jgi:hypothetical protein